MNRCFTLSHILQVLKVLLTLIVIGFLYSMIRNVFGDDSFITNLFANKIVFTTYNIVGVILILAFIRGKWLGYKKAKLLYLIVGSLMLLSTIISYIPNMIGFVETISSWFNG